MKKIGLVLFAFLAMAFSVMAQDNGNGERRERRAPRQNKEQMVESMTQNQVKRLKLTKEQTDKMKVLNDELVTEMMANNNGRQAQAQAGSVNPRQMTAEQREAARKEREKRTTEMQSKYAKKVKAVLTPEQYTEFEKMQKERPQGRNQNGRRGGQGGGPRGGQGGGPRGGQGGFGGDR